MKAVRRFFVLVAAAAIALISCQKPEFEAPGTHSVKFVAGAPMTKTTLTEGTDVASYEWSDSDVDRIHVFENGVAAEMVEAVIVDGQMLVEAIFPDSQATSFEYTAFVNDSRSTTAPKVYAEQVSTEGAYDADSDILVAQPQTFGELPSTFEFRFARVVAMNKMTLKGLTAGAIVDEITITSDKALTGTYTESGYVDGANTVTLTTEDLVEEDGCVAFFFVTVPVADATLSIAVSTDEGDYQKTFSKTISFNENTLTRFNVNLAGCEAEDPGEDPSVGQTGWFLMTSASFLHDGDVIRIASTANGKAAGPVNSKSLPGFDAAFSDGKMTGADSAVKNYTLNKGTNGWLLTYKDSATDLTCYLNADKVKVLSEGYEEDTATEWTISIASSGAATISTSSYGKLLYNANATGGNIFRNYDSDPSESMVLPEIYKKAGNPVDEVVKQDQTLSFSSETVTAYMGASVTAPTLNGVESSGAVTYSSSNTSVATVTNTGVLTLVGVGTTTITASVDGDSQYNSATASYTLTVKAAQTGGDWVLVTDASVLSTGNLIAIVAKDASNAMGAVGSTGLYMTSTAVTKTDNKITMTDDIEQLLLGAGTVDGSYSLRATAGYLSTTDVNASDGKNRNELACVETVDANSSWTIAVASDGTATITAQGEFTPTIIRYNESSPRFSCYAEGNQKDILIYRQETNQPKCATPVITQTGLAVTIACETSGASIYYTLDGTTPTTSSTLYKDYIELTQSVTVKAFATAAGYDNSAVATKTCTVDVDGGTKTVTEFLAASVSTDTWYTLSGTIKAIENATYGNLTLTDGTSDIYVYGITATKGGTKGQFQALIDANSIVVGGTLTVKCTRGEYNGKKEALNSYFVSYVAPASGGDGGDSGEGGDSTNPVTIVMDSSAPTTDGQTVSGVTVNCAKGNGGNAPAFTSEELRLYASNTVTVSAEKAFSKVELYFHKQGSKTYITSVTASTGTYTGGGDSGSSTTTKTDTWTGSASEVTFTMGASGQRVLEKVVVTF